MTAITPPSASAPERRLDDAGAERLDDVPASLPATSWNADDIPEAWLPHLAWALSVDDWNPDWDLATRRAAVRGAIDAHRRKGTPAGVKGVLERMGAVYDYEENTNGPFTASVTIHNQGTLQISDALSVRQLIDAHKRASVHIDLTLQSSLFGDLPVAAGLGVAVMAEFSVDAPA